MIERRLQKYRVRAAGERPSQLRRHAKPTRYTLVAAFCWQRRKEIIDGLVESQASNNKVGLWAADDPVPPCDWRASKRNNAPVSADVVPNGVRIAGLLPNPTGPDRGKEQAVIANTTAEAVDLRGWKLVDRAGNKFLLSGTVEQKGQVVVTMADPTMPLNNNGDDVLLVDTDGIVRSKVSYTEGQVRSGRVLRFGRSSFSRRCVGGAFSN